MTGRTRMFTNPRDSGARTVNVNVATLPGATIDSFCTATRLDDGQPAFMPIAEYAVLSPGMPSAISLPATPFVQVFEPLLRNESVTVDVAAGCSAATDVCPTHAECRPLSVGTAATEPLPPPLMVEPVLKSHWFVAMTPFTLMSKRT